MYLCLVGRGKLPLIRLLPRLASGKASTLLASLALACAKAYKVLFARSTSVKAKDLIQLKSRISAALNMRLRLGDHIVP